jgi:hypothetical protein
MSLTAIRDVLLDKSSTTQELRAALDDYAQLGSEITGVVADASFDGWAADEFLDQGVAINPQAAAHCVKDYWRSVVFIRAVNAAIDDARLKFPGQPIRILYAGCGPYATLLLPLLGKYLPAELNLSLLDVHQRSLDAVQALINCLGLAEYDIKLVRADACRYQHTSCLHLIVTETMQKSLEQEPQFAVTANLATQLCPGGIFLPEKIEVTLGLARLDPAAGPGISLGTVLTLSAASAPVLLQSASYNESSASPELPAVSLQVPVVENLPQLELALFTRIQVYGIYELREYEAEITLPQRCHDIASVHSGDVYRVSYQLGSYPRFSCVLDAAVA